MNLVIYNIKKLKGEKMELFKQFNETIFYKKDSELEYQLNALKKLSKEYPSNDSIARRLKICELGYNGEHEIEYELKNANIGMYVLHDINLKYKDLTELENLKILSPTKIKFHGQEIIDAINN